MVLPTPHRPDALERAAQVVEQRHADLTAVRAELVVARAAIEEAREADRNACVEARDAGEDDPGGRHMRAAEEHVADIQRRLEGETLRSQRAEQALRDVLADNLDAWTSRLEQALAAADRASLTALERLVSAEDKRSELRGAVDWLAGARRGQPPSKVVAGPLATPIKLNLSGDRLSTSQALEAVRAAISESSLEGRQRREAERAQAELEAERMREQRRAMTAAAEPR